MDEGYILDKRIGIGQPHRIENAKILVANTPMDTDKIKIYGARVRVDSMTKVNQKGGVGGVILPSFSSPVLPSPSSLQGWGVRDIKVSQGPVTQIETL